MNKNILTDIYGLKKFDLKFSNIINSFINDSCEDKICNFILECENLEEEILNIANDSHFGNTSRLKSIKDVLDYFGKYETMAFALYNYFERTIGAALKSYKISGQTFKEIAILRNAVTYHWIKESDDKNLKFLPATAMVLEFGRIFIDEQICMEQKSEEFYNKIKNCIFPSDFMDVEREFCNCDRESVDAILFEHFGLNEIATLTKYSNSIDDANFNIKNQCAMLKVVKTAVNIYHRMDELSMDNTFNLLDEFMLEHDAFLKAAQKVIM